MALYNVAGGNDGPGSFIGFYKEADGTMRHITGAEYQKYLEGGNAETKLSQADFTKLLNEPGTKATSTASSTAGYLDPGAQASWDAKAPKKAPAAPAAPAGPTPDNPMTSLLARFGVDYQDAPAPTPAMLAFMRGLGLSLDTAADAKQRTVSRIKERTTSTMADIDRGDERTKTNMLADLVRRGVLRSGETNTRYGQQAENVARSKSDALRASAEGIDAADLSYNQTRDMYRQQALERTIGAETDQATRAASSAAQAESYARQDAAAELAYTRAREAEDRRVKAEEDRLAKLGVA